MFRSVITIYADVVRKLKGADGAGTVVAVLGSGIDAPHPHFALHRNLELGESIEHKDSTGAGEPLVDSSGSGTSIASVVAGEHDTTGPHAVGAARVIDAEGQVWWQQVPIGAIAGMAPKAKLLSLRVLDDTAQGTASTVISALQHVDELNEQGSRLRVHVVLAAVGYHYNPEWFACGKSPICLEVDRLVRSGVVVVTVSGNAGFGYVNAQSGTQQSALLSTIMDPGNAELALTVGSTHREQPSEYGVSYFSSRGPTHDGRPKPDLVAPGERIMSAVAQDRRGELATFGVPGALYAEDSGTSYAGAHVAGVAAQILSVRPNLTGRPHDVKKLLIDSAIDLGRARECQGAGLIDALGALSPELRERGPGLVRHDARDRVARRAREAVEPLRLMCCYSHKDERQLEELKAHLSPLQHQRRIDLWWDRRIEPGAKWDEKIVRELRDADIIVLLVSSDFINSDYCYGVELTRAIERHEAGDAVVVPVLVRAFDFDGTPIAHLQALPKDRKAVESWTNKDEAWVDVARGIRQVVEKLDTTRGRPPGQ